VELMTAPVSRKRPRWRAVLFSALILGMTAWTIPTMARDGYEYLVAAPCRDGISEAIRTFRAQRTDAPDVKTIGLFWAARGKELREDLTAVLCMGDVAEARDAFLPKLDAWVAFMEAAGQTGEYDRDDYVARSQQASAGLERLKKAVGFEE
jgi:hypothetical protein